MVFSSSKKNNPPSMTQVQRKQVIVSVTVVFGIFAHFIIAALFYYFELEFLAFSNLCGVAVLVTANFLNRKGSHSIAIQIIGWDVIIHSTLHCIYVGTSLGFQYYLWPTICLIAMDAQINQKLGLAISLSCLLCLILINTLLSHVANPFPEGAFTYTIMTTNMLFSGFALIAGIMAATRRFHTQQIELLELSQKDELTQLPNRRYMRAHIRQILLASAKKDKICLAMGDIDHFKKVNDIYGHDEGDRVLIETAKLFKNHLRPNDRICRWGGEEFLIALLKTNDVATKRIIDRISATLTSTVKLRGEGSNEVSISFGIAEFEPGESFHSALKRADQALYSAKTQGRKRSVIADKPSAT